MVSVAVLRHLFCRRSLRRATDHRYDSRIIIPHSSKTRHMADVTLHDRPTFAFPVCDGEVKVLYRLRERSRHRRLLALDFRQLLRQGEQARFVWCHLQTQSHCGLGFVELPQQ